VADIRHPTASAVVLDESGQVLLIHHNRLGQWLYPGGHIEPNENPAQAVLREIREETGLTAEIICDPLPQIPSLRTLPPPLLITEMRVHDRRIGLHHHIDHLYVCRVIGSPEPTPLLSEVSGCRWVTRDQLAEMDVPADLPGLISYAADWAAVPTRLGCWSDPT
jgi:8-oxo-dGTP diphosphatase